MRETPAHSRLPRACAVVVSLLSLIAPVTGWTQTAPATASFDVDVPPFSRISIGDLFQVSPDYYSKENPGCPPEYLSTTINQVVDGLVFLKPLASYQGGTVSPKCFDVQFMKKITRRMGSKVRTKKDLYEYLLEIRPILGKSLEPLIKTESKR